MNLKDFLYLWKDALIHPKETFQKEKGNASLRKAIMNVLIAGIIPGIFILVFQAFILSEITKVVAPIFNIPPFGFFELFLFLFVFFLIAYIFHLLIISFILFISAKILQGNGSFTTQTYLISIFFAPLILISIFNLIPVLNFFTSIVIGIYSLYLLTLSLQETHEFSTLKAVLTWLIPGILFVILIVLFVGILMISLPRVFLFLISILRGT
ncbi:MAG: YIP1 family protein [Candidatus Altiarchaeota archaeon]